MDVRNCKGCGKLFNYMSGVQLCPECRAKLEKKFSSVKDYIGEHPQASISQVAEDMDAFCETDQTVGERGETDPLGSFFRWCVV